MSSGGKNCLLLRTAGLSSRLELKRISEGKDSSGYNTAHIRKGRKIKEQLEEMEIRLPEKNVSKILEGC